ncbi:hypothetical protein [Paracoccus lichenicola]|nr:hypothetical protein [Paracoccus lichenicola]
METTLDRTNLRVTPEMMLAIDAARLRRAGSVSRNTWIVEAIAEKLTRDEGNGETPVGKTANA